MSLVGVKQLLPSLFHADHREKDDDVGVRPVIDRHLIFYCFIFYFLYFTIGDKVVNQYVLCESIHYLL